MACPFREFSSRRTPSFFLPGAAAFVLAWIPRDSENTENGITAWDIPVACIYTPADEKWYWRTSETTLGLWSPEPVGSQVLGKWNSRAYLALPNHSSFLGCHVRLKISSRSHIFSSITPSVAITDWRWIKHKNSLLRKCGDEKGKDAETYRKIFRSIWRKKCALFRGEEVRGGMSRWSTALRYGEMMGAGALNNHCTGPRETGELKAACLLGSLVSSRVSSKTLATLRFSTRRGATFFGKQRIE
jgi:hypothetical protein